LYQSTLDPLLIEAYQNANYYVRSAQPFIMQIGEKSDGLIDLCRRLRVSCAAFITAYNPFGEILTDEENKLRNNQLKLDIDTLELTVVKGFGQDKLGEWGQEESFLICGLDLDASKKVGMKYQQNAIVWFGADAIPRLILLR
jgi:hypothetical protein